MQAGRSLLRRIITKNMNFCIFVSGCYAKKIKHNLNREVDGNHEGNEKWISRQEAERRIFLVLLRFIQTWHHLITDRKKSQQLLTSWNLKNLPTWRGISQSGGKPRSCCFHGNRWCPLMVRSTQCSFRVSLLKKLKLMSRLLSERKNLSALALRFREMGLDAEILLNLRRFTPKFSAVPVKEERLVALKAWRSWVGSVSTGRFLLRWRRQESIALIGRTPADIHAVQ